MVELRGIVVGGFGCADTFHHRGYATTPVRAQMDKSHKRLKLGISDSRRNSCYRERPRRGAATAAGKSGCGGICRLNGVRELP
ncbi:protein of unknown function [Hyphomicrobium sp. MC1]|nr:protein of unknown function [Hyphomicrobium sp. MC1]